MGGWIALRMAQELMKEDSPPAGIVLIAPAPDFTAVLVEPTLSEAQKNDLQEKGYFEEPSEYSPNPYIYTRALIEDGRRTWFSTASLRPAVRSTSCRACRTRMFPTGTR